jgi:hypothetical protein
MKFIYFYSPMYEFYHKHINENLKNYFNLESILIDDLKIKSKDEHHFTGHNIKIELIIDQIKKNMGQYIIFSDATIFINQKNSNTLNNYLLNYTQYDIVFMNGYNHYNIGFMLINCNKEILQFFENVLNSLINQEFTHDQKCINELIKLSTNFSHTHFDKKIFCDEFIENERENFIIWKSFIINTGNSYKNYNIRIDKFYNLNLIDYDTYKLWIKQDII